MLEIIAAEQQSLLVEDAYTIVIMPHSQFKVYTQSIQWITLILYINYLQLL